MKTKIQMLLVLSFLLLLGAGCKKEEAAAVAAAAPSKDLFSSDWYISNRAWSLDIRLGNLVSANFNMYANYSTGAQCVCTTNIMGDQTFGSIQTTCNASIPIGSVTNATCATDFGYGGTATYSNTGGVLRLCRTNTTNCLNYN